MALTKTVLSLFFAALSLQTEPAALDTQPTTQPSVAAALQQVPQSTDELTARLEFARQRIVELQPTTQPTTAPADEPDDVRALREARLACLQAWEAYAAQLQRAIDLRQNIPVLSGDAHLAQVGEELAQIQRQTRSWSNKPIPETVTSDQLESARSAINTLQARITVLAEEQARRAALLGGGLEQRREQLIAQRREVGQQIDALRKELATTANAAHDLLEWRLRRLHIDAATIDLNIQMLALVEQETGLRSRDDEQRLAALRRQLSAIQHYYTALQQTEGRTRMEVLQQRLETTTQPVDRGLTELELFQERLLAAFFQDPQRTATIQRIQTGPTIERLSERIELSKAVWERLRSSLAFRTAEEVLTSQRQLRTETAEFKTYLRQYEADHARLLSDLHHLRSVRDRALQRFSELSDQITDQARNLPAEERARVVTRISAIRRELTEAMQTAIKQVADATERLGTLLTNLREHTNRLAAVRQQLYWARIGRRDAGLAQTPWIDAGAELTTLIRTIASTPAPELSRQEALVRELFGNQGDVRLRTRELLDTATASFRQVPRNHWAWAAASLIVAALLGYGVYRGARRITIPLAARIEADRREAEAADDVHIGHGLSARIDLLVWNLVGDLAIPLLLAGALIGSINLLLDDAPTRHAARAVVLTLSAAIIVWRLIHHLFEANSPPHRPIPCSDAVARHYRWWLGTLIIFSLFTLVPAWWLQRTAIGTALPAALLEVFKAGFLLLLLPFLLRKQRVLGLLHTANEHWTYTLTSMLYPVLFIFVLGLFVLEAVGYGTLVTFVGQGVFFSLLTILAAATLSEYLADLLNRYAGPDPDIRPGNQPTTFYSTDSATADLAAQRTHYLLTLLKALLRLVSIAGAAWIILWLWNVPLHDGWLNWRLVGFGALTILIAIAIDRLVFAALFALYRSARLPLSTVNLLRRWLRGVLTVLVVLTLVAIAGWQIQSIWTFLTTLLAMIAIGFVAVWSILSNILATLVILIWRPFNVGEQVELLPDGLEGQVIDVNFMYTVLKAENDSRISVPNNLFAQKFVKRKPLRGEPTRTLAEQLEQDKPLGE